eukprot:gene5747-7936_t
MDLYGDLPPAGSETNAPDKDTGFVKSGGWARPNINLIPRQAINKTSGISTEPSIFTSVLDIKSSPKLPGTSLTNQADSSSKPTRFAPSSLAFKPRSQATSVKATSSSLLNTSNKSTFVISHETKDYYTNNNSIVNENDNNPNTYNNEEKDSPVFNSLESMDVEDSCGPYDPSRPNDYISWCEERLQMKRTKILDEENKKRMEEIQKANSELEEQRREAAKTGDIQKLQATLTNTGMGRGRGRGLVNLPAWMTANKDVNLNTNNPNIDSTDTIPPLGSTIISNLSNDDNTKNSITSNSSRIDVFLPPPAASNAGIGMKRKPGLFSKPSNVLLLKNMVSADEVDDMLADETTSECAKYGPVSLCLVYEVLDPNCPEEEKVRFFVQFESQGSAVKAYRDMNGRFFGGRQISASFYDEEAFKRRELAPSAGEW